jgi:hypothetical protein
MKKLLMTLVVSLALSGSIFAQSYETHWPGFYDGDYDFQVALVAAITIDGHLIDTADANWDALEVVAFIENVQRSYGMYLSDYYVMEYGDPYPTIDGESIYYTTAAGEHISFKMFDHINLIEYTECEVTYLDEPYQVVMNGMDIDQGWWEPYIPIMLNFTTPSFRKEIIGYGAENVDERTGWYLIASPVEANPGNVTNMTVGNYDLYKFDQTAAAGDDGITREWINYKSTADGFTLTPGEGYLYARETTDTLVFHGGATTETTFEVTLTRDDSEGCEFPGVNLVGNPFGVSAYLVNKDFYVMNSNHDEIIEAEEDEIPVMEGIIVIADVDGETLTFSTIPANTNANPSLALNVVANEGNVIDRAVVSFGKERTLPKFQLNPNNTKIYIPQENRDYAVVTAEEMGEMPVSFKAEKNGSYSLNFTSKEVSFAYLHLIDNKTGKDVDLLESPVYSFNAQTTDYASRFKLVFATGNNSEDNFAFNSNGNWIISNDGEATLQVIDVNGRILSSETISGSCSKAINAAPGVYMLRLINGDNMKVQKVVVK